MSETTKLRLELDYKQQRVLVDAQSVLAQGSYPGRPDRLSGWDPNLLSSDVWQDPVTWSLFLRPNVKKPEWNTTGTGDFARTRASAMTFETPASWKEVGHAFTSDYWQEADGLTADQSVITNSAYAANTPLFVSWFGNNAGQQRYVTLECGWNSTASGASGVSLRFWSDDEVEVWKDNEPKGVYKLGGSKGQAAAQQQFQSVMLLPCRKRELLVVSGDNTGFSHVFDDLNEDDDEPTIVAAEKFWLNFPVVAGQTRSAKFQLAQIKTSTSGTAVSKLLNFADSIRTAMAHDDAVLFADLYGGTVTGPTSLSTFFLVDSDGSTTFVPNGVKKECRVKVTLAGDGLQMLGLYGVLDGYKGLLEDTYDSAFDIVPYVHECHLRVCESADSVSMSVALGRLDELEAAWSASGNSGKLGIKTQTNRPVRGLFGTEETGRQLVIGGRSQNPKLELGFDDSVSVVHFEIRDRWAALERYVFREAVPLDGFLLQDALKYVVARVTGQDDPDRFDIEETTLVIPSGSSQAAGEWGFLIEVGDRASEVVERLIDTFAADWFYGFVPNALRTVFRARSVSTMSSEPVVELFLEADQAVAYWMDQGYGERQAVKMVGYRTVHSYRQETLPPEATEVRVTGQDARTGLPIQAFSVFPDLEDPTTSPGDRPPGWRGEKEVAGYCDGALSTQTVVESACEKFANRVCVPRTLGEFDCFLLFKPDGSLVWRGDVVRIYDMRDRIGGDPGTPEYRDIRITSIECELAKEPDEELAETDPLAEWSNRPATYTGELIVSDQDGWRARTRGAGIDQISDMHRRGNLLRPRAVRGFENLLQLSPFAIYEVP